MNVSDASTLAEGEDFLTDLCFIKKYANFACETINRNRVYA